MRRDHLVTIKAPASGVDEIGQPLTGWTTFASEWANIRHLSGIEAIKAGAMTSTIKVSIEMRRRSDITAAMQVEHGGITYKIEAVLPDLNASDSMFLACEVVA